MAMVRGGSALDVKGRVALVTGGADGIGWETARQLHARGASVAILDRDGAAAERAARTLGARSLALTADVTDRARMREAIDEVGDRFGGLDIVVANAGITPPPATIRTSDPADFDRVVAVNVTGVLNTVHPAIESLITRRGHIVVVASVAAFCPPIAGAAYMVSKAAVEQLGRGLKLELAPHGVTVTVAYFGVVETALARAAFDVDPLGAELDAMLPRPLRARITAEHAGGVLVRAITSRAPTAVAPRAWGVISRLRGLVNPSIDRRLARDERLHALLAALERRRGR